MLTQLISSQQYLASDSFFLPAMGFRTYLTYLSLLPLSACTHSCNDYDNNEEFTKATLPLTPKPGPIPWAACWGRRCGRY